MNSDEPLPLLVHPPNKNENAIEMNLDPERMKFYGYLILTSTWIIFIISMNTFFEAWKFLLHPLSQTESMIDLYTYLYKGFTVLDDYVLKIWCIYVVIWWWAIISWCGMKLFRHSKGLQT